MQIRRTETLWGFNNQFISFLKIRSPQANFLHAAGKCHSNAARLVKLAIHTGTKCARTARLTGAFSTKKHNRKLTKCWTNYLSLCSGCTEDIESIKTSECKLSDAQLTLPVDHCLMCWHFFFADNMTMSLVPTPVQSICHFFSLFFGHQATV